MPWLSHTVGRHFFATWLCLKSLMKGNQAEIHRSTKLPTVAGAKLLCYLIEHFSNGDTG
jgi:hypothetical protein